MENGKHVGCNTLIKTLLMLVLISSVQVAWAGEALYRYRSDSGVVVIDDHVPPQFVKNGYEILNSLGQVVEEVPRQMSAEELRNLSSEEAQKRKEKMDKEKQQALDHSLLMRYSDVHDIEAARNRSVKDLEIRVSILRGNILGTKSQVERQQARAADIERQGNKVPDNLLENIKQLQQEIELAELAVTARRQEIDEVKLEYQKEIERLRYLTEVLGYRRR